MSAPEARRFCRSARPAAPDAGGEGRGGAVGPLYRLAPRVPAVKLGRALIELDRFRSSLIGERVHHATRGEQASESGDGTGRGRSGSWLHALLLLLLALAATRASPFFSALL